MRWKMKELLLLAAGWRKLFMVSMVCIFIIGKQLFVFFHYYYHAV